MQFTLYSINHKNKQTASDEDKLQDKFKVLYLHVLKTLGKP